MNRKYPNFDNVLLATHYTPTPGPMDKLADYFVRHGSMLTLISFPLFPKSKLPCVVDTPAKKITFNLPWFLQYVIEGIYAACIYNKTKDKTSIDLAICGDPLAFIHIFMLRKLFEIKKIVYFNVDFSTKRYQNRLLNHLYQKINKFAYIHSDYFLALTPKFTQFVDKQKKYTDKAFVLSHWIHRNDIDLDTKRKKGSLVYAGSLTTGLNFEPLFKALLQLRENNINWKLDIYGAGGEEDNLKKRIAHYQLETQVTMKGVIDNARLTSEILPRYMIGVCPYILRDTVRHADHMFQGVGLTTKLVEYSAAGLPIVTTPLTESFRNISKYNFGFLAETPKDWYRALYTLLTDTHLHQIQQKNALEYAVQFDEEEVLGNIFRKMQ